MSAPVALPIDAEKALYAKVSRRIIPFLFLCYVFAFVDRVNVGFAKLQMQQDLHMSDAVYGVGAGIFFIGYFFFEIPCNLILQRIGAKRWLGPIMVLWGIVSGCQMFVTGATSLYLIRFVLGVVECGFFPGVILYLTFWYPQRYRAKMLAAFMTGLPISGIVGGPVSGWILGSMSGTSNLQAWQWLFLFEAIPSVLAGLLTLWILDDGPRQARWLTEDEKRFLEQTLVDEERAKGLQSPGHHSFSDAFRSPRVWLFCVIYFGMVMVNYGISFWLPQIVKETLSRDPFKIGLLTAIPWTVAAFTMVAVGHHSDKTGERRWHIALTSIVCSAAFAASAIPGISGVMGFVALTVATACIASSYSTFWSLPTTLLSGTAASAGIAWINSVGNLAGYVSPFLVGRIRDTTHSMVPALLLLSLSCFVSGILTLRVKMPRLTPLVLFFPLVFVAFSQGVHAQEQTNAPLPPGQNPKGMHVYLWAGLKSHQPGQHDYPQFLADWSKLLTERGAVVDGSLHPPSAHDLESTDVLVIYKGDAGFSLHDEERAALTAFVKRGGGLVSLHDSLCGPDPDYLSSLFGGAKKHGEVNYTLDAPVHYAVADQGNPIMKDMSDITLEDEAFFKMTWAKDPGVHVLANASIPRTHSAEGHVGEVVPQVWTYEHTLQGGQPARAFVWMQGHIYANFANYQIQRTLLRGIAWAGRKPVDELVDYVAPPRPTHSR